MINKSRLKDIAERATPRAVRSMIKKSYRRILNIYSIFRYINKGKRVDFGYRFRFTRSEPYKASLEDGSALDDFNVWSAKAGDIKVGKNCWFGIHNIVMGPVEIGDDFSSGPHVSIVGPHHAFLAQGRSDKTKTVIGKKVWVSTGAVILFGVTIGDGAIIGPASLVDKNVPPGAYVCGNPARNLSGMIPKLQETWNQGEQKKEG